QRQWDSVSPKYSRSAPQSAGLSWKSNLTPHHCQGFGRLRSSTLQSHWTQASRCFSIHMLSVPGRNNRSSFPHKRGLLRPIRTAALCLRHGQSMDYRSAVLSLSKFSPPLDDSLHPRPAHTLIPSAKQRPLPRAAILPPPVSIPLLKNDFLLQSAVLYPSAITSFLLSILVYSLVF